MHRFLLVLALAAGLGPGLVRAETACPAAVPGWIADHAMPLSHVRLADKPLLKIVAIGSSSTEGSGASARANTYPALLEARLRAALPGVRVKVINRGIGGEDAAQNLARFDADVLALRPSLVIWQAGANMAMRRGEPHNFRTLLERGVELLKTEGIDVILVDSQASPRVIASPRNDEFLAAVRDTAHDQEVGLFPRFALMQYWRARDPASVDAMVGPDQLHHTDAGYACMADALAAMILAGLR